MLKLIKKFICKIFNHKMEWSECTSWKEYDDGIIKHISGLQFNTWSCKRCGINSEDSRPFPPENEFKLEKINEETVAEIDAQIKEVFTSIDCHRYTRPRGEILEELKLERKLREKINELSKAN